MRSFLPVLLTTSITGIILASKKKKGRRQPGPTTLGFRGADGPSFDQRLMKRMIDKRCTRTASWLPLIGLEMLKYFRQGLRRKVPGVAVSFLPASCLELLALAKKEGALKHGWEKKNSRTHLSLRIQWGVCLKEPPP